RSSFFFQAEDGIRAFHVTGVQTCALPISRPRGPVSLSRPVTFTTDQRCFLNASSVPVAGCISATLRSRAAQLLPTSRVSVRRIRSEERRVGKECRPATSSSQRQ